MFKFVLLPALFFAVQALAASRPLRRQDRSPLPDITIPAGCETACAGLSAVQNPTDIPSFCTTTFSQGLKSCLECGIRLGRPEPGEVAQAQSSLNEFVQACAVIGKQVPALSLDTAGAAGTSPPVATPVTVTRPLNTATAAGPGPGPTATGAPPPIGGTPPSTTSGATIPSASSAAWSHGLGHNKEKSTSMVVLAAGAGLGVIFAGML